MTSHADITDRIESIKGIFQQGQVSAEAASDFFSLAEKLDETDAEYRSVAYEGASMNIALTGFENDDGLIRWHEFKNGVANLHSSQVHAGLGWAISQKRINPKIILETLSPLMKFRTVDGCGYYDGIFRQRSAISGRNIPSEIPAPFLFGYDQGVGRAIYYACKGDPGKIKEMIFAFPESRQTDLWRGLGIACAYVGGCDEKLLRELYLLASKYSAQLSVSAALVARARSDANALTTYAEAACNAWCNCSAADAIQQTLKAEALLPADDGTGKAWLAAIVEELSPISSSRD